MREFLVNKFFLAVGLGILLVTAFFAGGIALASVSAASTVSAGKDGGTAKCEKKEPHCQGESVKSAQTKAVVLVKSVNGNSIRGTVVQAASNVQGTITIITTASTQYEPDQSVVAAGKTIFVVGVVNTNGSITAQTLGAYDPTQAAVSGMITSISGSTVTIQTKDSTRTILLTESTTYARIQPDTKQTTLATLKDLKVGESIEVSGRLNSNGSLTAMQVFLIPDDAQKK